MIEINNLTKFVISKKFFTGLAKKVLRGENRERENISVAFVTTDEIKKLNKTYRKKDLATDVLSFEKVSDFKKEPAEIVICPEVVKKNSQKFGATFRKELSKMLIHGILHTLGYDHEKSEKEAERMQEREKKYLSKI
jgi:probable rRNA maturation factor